MKTLKCLAALCLLSTTMFAGDLTEADKKWGGVVEKMIADGTTTISTPSESRAKLAKEIAARHRRECQIEKTATGYKVVLQPGKMAKN